MGVAVSSATSRLLSFPRPQKRSSLHHGAGGSRAVAQQPQTAASHPCMQKLRGQPGFMQAHRQEGLRLRRKSEWAARAPVLPPTHVGFTRQPASMNWECEAPGITPSQLPLPAAAQNSCGRASQWTFAGRQKRD